MDRSRLGLMNADCFGCSASLLLDLSAALDMIDHGSLDDELRDGFYICGTILYGYRKTGVYTQAYHHTN